MPDMFGAPAGISAAEDQLRQNIQGGLLAQKTLGEIEAQPGAKALQAAHARYYNAEALAKEQEAVEMSQLGTAAQGVFGGQGGGAEQLSGPGFVPGQAQARQSGSLVDAFAQMTRIAGGMGYTKKAEEFAKTTYTLAEREQQISTAKANQQLHVLQAQREQLKQHASLAASAVDDPSYAQMRMILHSQGMDTSDMPESYAAAKPMLEQIVTMGQEADKVLAARMNAPVKAAEVVKYRAQAGAATASSAAATSRKKVLDQTYDLRKKYDGDTSGAMRDLRKARTKATEDADVARADAQAARDRAKFPPPSAAQIADPSKLTRGQSYSTPKGVLTWTGTGWVPMRTPKVAVPDESDTDIEAE